MRRLSVLVALCTALVLAGCGEENTSPDIDLGDALLAPDDLPDGAEVHPVDRAGLTEGLGQTQDGVIDDQTYDPAECQDVENIGFYHDDVESAGMISTVGEGHETDILQQSVFFGVDGTDLSELENYYQDCGEITISGTMKEHSTDMEQVVITSAVDAPSVDADEVSAFEHTVSVSGTGRTGMPYRMIYMIADDYAIYLGGATESEKFDVDELADLALERLNEVRD